MAKAPVVDVHSHLYPQSWISLLRSRTTPPYISSSPSSTSNEQTSRLVNRVGVAGKPLLPNLFDITTKIAFMDKHGIDISVLSLGNPWLDFLEDGQEAVDMSREINEEMQDLCSLYPGRLFFFGCLPTPSSLSAILSCIEHLQTLSLHRGVVMGYRGFGSGLDDASMQPLFQALANAGLPVFLHPNYGLPNDVFGPCCGDHGQVLPVSLGFTTETTIAVTRMYLAGVFDKIPDLQLILSHAGGTLPFLAGRIDGTIANFQNATTVTDQAPRKSIWDVLRQNIYLDGIVFDKIPLRAAADAVGVDRVMFGTDHPLFPSLRGDGLYDICVKNQDATEACFGKGADFDGVMGGNALKLLNLK